MGPQALTPGREALSILVVDDDPAALTSLRFLLESEGYDVVTFRNGPELLAALPGRDADCIIIDYKMPVLDGLDVFHRLRGLQVRTPVVMITGHPDPTMRRKADEAGLLLIDKPLSQDALLIAVKAASLHRGRDQGRGPA